MEAEIQIDLNQNADPSASLKDMGFDIIKIFTDKELSCSVIVISGSPAAIHEIVYNKTKRPNYIISASKRGCFTICD